eukprot:scaffold1766_cov401-Prasinococcus_capsulatus_cf.AAC.40
MARTVRPSTAVETSIRMPKFSIKATASLAMMSNQTMLEANDRTSKTASHRGWRGRLRGITRPTTTDRHSPPMKTST